MSKQIRGGAVTLYRFVPDGSKNIENLQSLSEYTLEEFYISPEIYCCDQELLNYERYDTEDPIYHLYGKPSPQIIETFATKNIKFPHLNLRGQVVTIWDRAILLHSEKRSLQAQQYQSTQFILAYYWCNAVLALDWYRYAQYTTQKKQISKTFLIYNRAWSGTREYRLRFADLLVEQGLVNYCCTSINCIDAESTTHYTQHKFENPVWKPKTLLENFFTKNTTPSYASADFDIDDYNATDIEVVLETLFDDDRLHLTEKSLRPIACAQPFILASTHGSLEYLRSYGFQTFGHIWNEDYDQVEDPLTRLMHILTLMRQIANWSSDEQEEKMIKARAIADFNKKHFFSAEFFNLINSELKNNLTAAFTELENTNGARAFLHRHRVFNSDPDLVKLSKNGKTLETKKQMLKLAEYYNSRHSPK